MNASAWKRLAGMVPLSLLDWPGRPCAVVFVRGCDLRCPHCHNADIAWGDPKPTAMSPKALLDALSARAPLLDGVVLSGGEPLFGDDVSPLVESLFGLGLPVRVDTNGMHPAKLAELAERFADLHFAVDVKAPPARYPEVTGNGVTAQAAQDNLNAVARIAAAQPERFLFRTVALPQLTRDDLAWTAAFTPTGSRHMLTPYQTPKAHRDPHAQENR